MPTQLVLLKGLASVGGAAAVGGGSYVVYQNSDSIKSIFVRKQVDSTTDAPAAEKNTQTPADTRTNLFLVRYKSDKASTDQTLTAETSLTCTIASSEIPCKIYKFGESPKLNNSIATGDNATLTAVTSSDTSFVDNSHLVIELTGVTKTAAELQNKTISLKTGQTELGKFEFDQILIGEAATSATVQATAEDSYIIKTPTAWNASTVTDATSYRCKFTSTETDKLANYDPSCKLVKFTAANSETVTSFEHFKSLNTQIAATALSTETAASSYYKLIVDRNLMYNLFFDGTSTTPVNVELLKNNTPTSVGDLEIQQKLVGNKFVGKTVLVLAKVKTPDASAIGTFTTAKCNLDGATTITTGSQFECNLFTTTKSGSTTEKALTFTDTEITASQTWTADEYYVIKIKEAKNISDFDSKTSIYYQIPDTNQGGTNAKNIEFDIVALMSGEAAANKKPIFIKTATAA